MIHLDRNIPFVKAALEGSIAEASAILHAAAHRQGFRLSLWSEPLLPESDDDKWFECHLWPFFSETHFILTGGDFQSLGCSLIGLDGFDHTCSWRQWGSTVAHWANQHWVARPAGLGTTKWTQAQRPWEYLDFYSSDYLSYLIAGYNEWREALGKVISYPRPDDIA